MAGIRDYSTTPANNVALFPEGMAPSQVNDSATPAYRRIVREWYNDAEWIIYGDGDGAHGIAYGSATGFSVTGANVASVYHTGPSCQGGGALTGTIYGTIASSAFATNTTVNVTWDAGSAAERGADDLSRHPQPRTTRRCRATRPGRTYRAHSRRPRSSTAP